MQRGRLKEVAAERYSRGRTESYTAEAQSICVGALDRGQAKAISACLTRRASRAAAAFVQAPPAHTSSNAEVLPFIENYRTIMKMGFTDERAAIRALAHNDGDLESAILELIKAYC